MPPLAHSDNKATFQPSCQEQDADGKARKNTAKIGVLKTDKMLQNETVALNLSAKAVECRFVVHNAIFVGWHALPTRSEGMVLPQA
jgi:hypothetical protein